MNPYLIIYPQFHVKQKVIINTESHIITSIDKSKYRNYYYTNLGGPYYECEISLDISDRINRVLELC